MSVNSTHLKRLCLFIVYVYAFIDFNSSEVKDEFYRESSWLLRNVR